MYMYTFTLINISLNENYKQFSLTKFGLLQTFSQFSIMNTDYSLTCPYTKFEFLIHPNNQSKTLNTTYTYFTSSITTKYK